MLKDKLTLLADYGRKRDGVCLLGKAMREMDKETLEAFILAMKSDASAPQILDVLQEEGLVAFGITHFRDKRRECFRSNAGCTCITEAQNDEK